MKWELDDNTSDGIRFLLIGAGSLLLLRLGYAGVVQLVVGPPQDALAEACVHFQSGYWMNDPHTVVLDGGAGFGTRLALSAITTVLVAVVLAGLTHLITACAGQVSGSWAVRTLRVALIIPFCWWLFAALTRPPVQLRFDNAGIVQEKGIALFDQLSLPWPAERTEFGWAEVEQISTRMSEVHTMVCAITRGDTLTLAVGNAHHADLLAQELRTLAGKP